MRTDTTAPAQQERCSLRCQASRTRTSARFRSLLAGLVVTGLALATACGRGADRTMVPGYRGPVPGAEAQRLLHELCGRTTTDPGLAPDGRTWTLESFAVVPHPASGKGPFLGLRSGTEERWIPVLTDGDAADVWQRVTGEPPPIEASQRSAAYEASLAAR